jgi:hypothetical protein
MIGQRRCMADANGSQDEEQIIAVHTYIGVEQQRSAHERLKIIARLGVSDPKLA